MNKILLVDGNLLLFRSFYAAYAFNKEVNNLPTHLFLTSLLEVIKQEKPDFIFVAFDAHGKTKRHEMYKDYKAGRTSPPPSIYEQKKIILNLLDLAKIKWFEQIGDEADDLIATIATKYSNNNKIVIFSEDKDLMQLIEPGIEILIKDRKNKSKSYIKINNENFFDIFNLYPYQIPDFKGIAGDSSDNLKGIKGIGEKTAIQLLAKYKNLENIYENIDQLSQIQKNKFIESKEDAFMCKNLALLNRLVFLNFKLDDFKFEFNNLNTSIFLDQLKKYNLNKLFSLLTK